eukprot:scaffold60895_cov63-Phaeocystis_antarctica.AAC.5
MLFPFSQDDRDNVVLSYPPQTLQQLCEHERTNRRGNSDSILCLAGGTPGLLRWIYRPSARQNARRLFTWRRLTAA